MSAIAIENRYMEFRLGDQLYALPLLNVKEVIQKQEITNVPNMPAHFEGMINLRGQILGVFNVRKRLASSQKTNLGSPEVIIVVEQNNVSVGMIVDEVTRVLHAEPEMIEDAPLKDDDMAKKYIASVIKANDELILTIQVTQLLDLDKYKTPTVEAA